jgi:hypothetical protein
MLSAYNLYKDFGVTRSSLNFCIQRIWNVDNFKDCLNKSYLLIWKSDYLLDQIAKGNGCISHQGTDYVAIYHKISRGSILKADADSIAENSLRPKYKLSFRATIQQANLPNYVLVTGYFGSPSLTLI